MLTALQDKAQLTSWLQQDPGRYLCELGDLDPFFWPYTRWWGWSEAGEITALALCYTGDPTPVLLLNSPAPASAPLLQALLDLQTGPLSLPCYAHLAPGLLESLPPGRHFQGGKAHLHMVLQADALPEPTQPEDLRLRILKPGDAGTVQLFLQEHYPDNWFNPRMLTSAAYLGLFRPENGLVAVAGVHVYSPSYGVAALGNIAVHTHWRGRGLGLFLTTALCQLLLARGMTRIGLNVAEANGTAQHVYQAAGFSTHARYQECLLQAASLQDKSTHR
ncbi:MAG: GNAT family N-acetyltransferase [Candidatus Sericytochromatia bacterium]|nr:GNAT family N-acetyltransferase [Candidatus Sericytochromatia bacterium]